MTKVAEQKPAGYLKKFLMDPKAVKATAAMPTFGITSDEADNLITFLEWISKVDTNDWPPKPILAAAAGAGGKTLSAGQRIYQEQGCSACHSISGIGGTSGPDLTTVGSRRDHEWLLGHFKDPSKYVKDSAMPAVTAPDADLELLTAYMLTLKGEVTK
jgi:nitric oxide reductase subunit C